MLSAIVTVMAAVPAAGAGSLSPACTILLNSPPVLSARRDRGKDEIRQSYRDAVRRAASHCNPDPLEVTPELLLLYWELVDPDRSTVRRIGNPSDMPSHERRRMLRGLKVRLEFQWKRLVRLQRKAQKSNRRSPRTALTSDPDARSVRVTREKVASSGGGVAAQAATLIDLIRNTIQPDSWDVNGGLGTISFLGDPFYVLVIRNTGDVHNQIGGVLRP
jgi:hypothetical protein